MKYKAITAHSYPGLEEDEIQFIFTNSDLRSYSGDRSELEKSMAFSKGMTPTAIPAAKAWFGPPGARGKEIGAPAIFI